MKCVKSRARDLAVGITSEFRLHVDKKEMIDEVSNVPLFCLPSSISAEDQQWCFLGRLTKKIKNCIPYFLGVQSANWLRLSHTDVLSERE